MQRVAEAGNKTINGTELYALQDGSAQEEANYRATFNVYDDIRDKLVAKGVPAYEVAFIHEANGKYRG